jgi:hypothetical protein
MPTAGLPSPLMRSAVALQLAFGVAVIAALGVTVADTSIDVRLLALAVVTPIIVLTFLCIGLAWRGSAWGFAGAGVLGVVGVGLRLAVSTQPTLEVGGGLPIEVTAVYIVLGGLVALTSFASALQLRGWGARHAGG